MTNHAARVEEIRDRWVSDGPPTAHEFLDLLAAYDDSQRWAHAQIKTGKERYASATEALRDAERDLTQARRSCVAWADWERACCLDATTPPYALRERAEGWREELEEGRDDD